MNTPSADVSGEGDASVGVLTMGDISIVAGDDKTGWFSAYVSAYANADTGDASISDVTIGDMSLVAGDGLERCADLYVNSTPM